MNFDADKREYNRTLSNVVIPVKLLRLRRPLGFYCRLPRVRYPNSEPAEGQSRAIEMRSSLNHSSALRYPILV